MLRSILIIGYTCSLRESAKFEIIQVRAWLWSIERFVNCPILNIINFNSIKNMIINNNVMYIDNTSQINFITKSIIKIEFISGLSYSSFFFSLRLLIFLVPLAHYYLSSSNTGSELISNSWDLKVKLFW